MSTMEPKFSSKYGVNQKVIQVRVGLHGVESYWGDLAPSKLGVFQSVFGLFWVSHKTWTSLYMDGTADNLS